MKTRTPLSLLMLGLVVALIVCVQAQNTSAAGQNEPILSGSALKSEDVIAKTDAVCVGQIEEMGFPTPSSPGVASYGVKVKVLQVLRGSHDAEITVKIDTFAVNHEGPPQAGTSYIFFIKKVPGYNIVQKLLPATDDNITKVKGVIAAVPVGR